MAQNCRGAGREAFRAASGGLAGDGRTGCSVTALGQQPTFTRSSTCVSARQTGPPARINQFKPPVPNKPQELSRRGLASACSACPDLNADLRASLASQLQRTAEKGSRLHQTPTKNVGDMTALCEERCQLEAFIPTPAVTALPEVTTHFSCHPPKEQNQGVESWDGRKANTLSRQQKGNPPTEAQRELRHPRDDVCPQSKKCPNLFSFKPVLQSGLDWDSYALYVAYTTRSALQEMTDKPRVVCSLRVTADAQRRGRSLLTSFLL
ncbi:hypothetical protein DUI87_13164 [Hirundo rustica rustica]|uniref:Uncharacterized protein n=1 Tax=Hirundo rustica rustica TaxID=333673 RepID=A0A3M0KCU6_HIRRU|nr:hypothetical protein DUI87_13164 [Hirundo rustica rustica]